MSKIPNANNISISFVVITLSNDSSFWDTFYSIQSEIGSDDEIVIVAPQTTCKMLKPEVGKYSCSTLLVEDRIEGIYPAQNLGVQHATNPWLCVVNSGDLILTGCREGFIRSIQEYSSAEVHCFAQQVIDTHGRAVYTSYPKKRRFLSHQSIVYSRSLHDMYGPYDASYLYCADQLFFAGLYGEVIFSFSDMVTSAYRLGGFSDRFSLRLAYESYKVRRLNRQGMLKAIVRSYILPLTRYVADRFVPGASTCLRCIVNRIII